MIRLNQNKMNELWRFVWYCGPLILWMGAIFWISHQPKTHLAPAQPSTLITSSGWEQTFLITIDWDTVVGKTAHMVVYAVLAFLIWRINPNWRIILVLATCFAVSDEVHQLFIPGRTGRVLDVVFDVLGVICMLWRLRRYGRIPQPTTKLTIDH